MPFSATVSEFALFYLKESIRDGHGVGRSSPFRSLDERGRGRVGLRPRLLELRLRGRLPRPPKHAERKDGADHQDEGQGHQRSHRDCFHPRGFGLLIGRHFYYGETPL